MSDIDVWDADLELAERAAEGPHKEWDTISIEMEGSRFQRLHDLVSLHDFDLEAEEACKDTIEELIELAKAAGYADADNFHNMSSANDSEGTANADHMVSMIHNPADSLYFKLVEGSEQILQRTAKTGHAKNLLRQQGDNRPGIIFSEMLAAYEDGRRERLTSDSTPAP
jgi:hypothetical protein